MLSLRLPDLLFFLRRAPAPKSRPGAGLTKTRELQRTRRALRRLDPAQLDDIGITPDQAEHESRRKAWDVPQNWRK